MPASSYTTLAALQPRAFVSIGLFSLIAGLLIGVGAAPMAQAAGQQIFDGPDAEVGAIATGADGTTYIGGQFTTWGPQTGGGAALSTADGSVNRNLPPVSGDVNAVTPDGVGGWYIGGSFSAVAGTPRANLAHILPTGALDLTWNPGANSTVRTLALSGGVLYAGGEFTSICTTAESSCWNGAAQSRTRLAAFNVDATPTAWNPIADSTVWAMAAHDSLIYVGGEFSTAGGQSRSRLAALDADGLATSWNPGAGDRVLSLAALGTNIYAGGLFQTVCTTATTSCWNGSAAQTRNRLAAFTTDGSLAAWNPSAANTVWTLAISGSTIYAGGSFTTICTTAAATCWNGTAAQTRNRLAAFTTDGTMTSWNPGASADVRTLASAGSTIYAGGTFTTVCTAADSTCWNGTAAQTRNRLAAFTTDGSLTAWNPNASGTVQTLVVSGNAVFAGGTFTVVGGQTRGRLAALDTAGTLTAWNPNANDTVNALAVSGSTVYIGGSFTSIGGLTRNRLAAVGIDGTMAAWNPSASSAVRSLAISGTTVYAGGQFTTVCTTAAATCWNGSAAQTRNRLAAIDTDGTLGTWNPGAGGTVRTLGVAGSTVYAGGDFTTVCTTAAATCWNGSAAQTRNRLAAINADGSLSSWNADADATVNALSVSGSTIYVGGTFAKVGGHARSRLAALTTDGAGTATSWNPNANLGVFSLTASGGTVYVGGNFSSINGQDRNRLAAISADGSVSNWNPSPDATVVALAASGSTVFAGGPFKRVGNTRDGGVGFALAALVAPSLPGAPTAVAATRGDTSANVTWAAPTDTGSGITGYKLETAPGPNYDTWTTPIANTGTTATSATVTGLANGTNYRVRVTALAADGAGGTSLASQWFTPIAPAATPSVPTGLTGTPGNGKITATWDPVIDVGVGSTHINRYRTFALSGTTAVRVCNTTGTLATPPATTCELTGLTNGQTFSLTTRSFNNRNKYSDLSPTAGPYSPSSN